MTRAKVHHLPALGEDFRHLLLCRHASIESRTPHPLSQSRGVPTRKRQIALLKLIDFQKAWQVTLLPICIFHW